MSDRDELDILVIGRSSVLLCGQQIGSGLEDAGSFLRSVGEGTAGLAIGLARLGLRTGLVSRLGDDHWGHFLLRQFRHDSVNVTGVRIDPLQQTGVSISCQGAEGSEKEMLVRGEPPEAEDLDRALLAGGARAILLAGGLDTDPRSAALWRGAIFSMRDRNGMVILDLAGWLSPERRTEKEQVPLAGPLAEVIPCCDLILGSEAEFRSLLGSRETRAALQALRASAPRATIVCWQEQQGCIAFDAGLPVAMERGASGQEFTAERCNASGYRDAATAGFLQGWLRGEELKTSCTYANAAGTLAAARPAGALASPARTELDAFLASPNPPRQPRFDAELAHIHWIATRRKESSGIVALACDHRLQLEQIADAVGAPHERIAAFKCLAVEAVVRVAAGRPGFGIFLDGRYGRQALLAASRAGLWTARPVERTGSRPLDFEGGADGTAAGSLGAQLVEWPVGQIVKCLCFYHPHDSDDLKARQIRELLRVQDACRRLERELLIEIIASKNGKISDETASDILQALYQQGLRPDWWKLEPQPSGAAWKTVGNTIARNDPDCHGVLMLGLDAPIAKLEAAFADVKTPWVRGFAIGRSIFADPARDWLGGTIGDYRAVGAMADRFSGLVQSWEKSCLPLPG